MRTSRGLSGSRATAPAAISAHRPRQQPVLDLVDLRLDRLDVASIWKLERLLQDDWPTVHALVHEVDRHPDHLHAVVERLLDRADARGRRAAATGAR